MGCLKLNCSFQKSVLSTKSTVSKNKKASRDYGEDDSILSSLADEVLNMFTGTKQPFTGLIFNVGQGRLAKCWSIRW